MKGVGVEAQAPIHGLARELGVSPNTVRADLADELRELRLRLPTHAAARRSPVTPGEWSPDLYAYDEALVVTANLLGVPMAPNPEFFVGLRRLTDFERRMLETGLAANGIDLRPE